MSVEERVSLARGELIKLKKKRGKRSKLSVISMVIRNFKCFYGEWSFNFPESTNLNSFFLRDFGDRNAWIIIVCAKCGFRHKELVPLGTKIITCKDAGYTCDVCGYTNHIGDKVILVEKKETIVFP